MSKKEKTYLMDKVNESCLSDKPYLEALTIIDQLKEQLAEKDKEIEMLRKEFSSRLRLIRHPICEEIRRVIRQPENSIFYGVSLYVETKGLEKLLDKLEKGE